MTTSILVEQLVQPRTWSMIHWRAASMSVPPPPKSWAGPARGTTTSAALPVRYRVTLAWAGSVSAPASSSIRNNGESVLRDIDSSCLVKRALLPSECAQIAGTSHPEKTKTRPGERRPGLSYLHGFGRAPLGRHHHRRLGFRLEAEDLGDELVPAGPAVLRGRLALLLVGRAQLGHRVEVQTPLLQHADGVAGVEGGEVEQQARLVLVFEVDGGLIQLRRRPDVLQGVEDAQQRGHRLDLGGFEVYADAARVLQPE